MMEKPNFLKDSEIHNLIEDAQKMGVPIGCTEEYK